MSSNLSRRSFTADDLNTTLKSCTERYRNPTRRRKLIKFINTGKWTVSTAIAVGIGSLRDPINDSKLDESVMFQFALFLETVHLFESIGLNICVYVQD